MNFYLTGGTALSRFYLNHRYSDDLDLFVNKAENFKEQCNDIFDLFKRNKIAFDVGNASDHFVRIFVIKDDLKLKIDFVNDIDYHYGDFIKTDIYPRIDNWRNILSNKLCALSRLEPKDFADIIYISKHFEFEWEDIMGEARQKDLWIDPIAISKLFAEFPYGSLKFLKWIKPINTEQVKENIHAIEKDILLGGKNSLFK